MVNSWLPFLEKLVHEVDIIKFLLITHVPERALTYFSFSNEG